MTLITAMVCGGFACDQQCGGLPCPAILV